jgi:hypothetical protein
MMTLNFEGWFQCRFATDPDPPDDPMGMSGPTFAVPGEPPLDRFIRLQNYIKPRYPRNTAAGVAVVAVEIDGIRENSHLLLGAAVDLLENPMFYQRNFIVTRQNLQAPIDPFHIQVTGKANNVKIRRKDLIDLLHPANNYDDVFLDEALVARRCNTMTPQATDVAEATGFMNYDEVRAQRKRDLEQLLAKERDPVERAALEKRILAIANDRYLAGERLAATQFLGMRADYAFAINGPAAVEDSSRVLKGTIGMAQAWPISFWMGGYDVDTMFGFLRGSLQVPFLPDSVIS